jgi:hypothetical protein
VGVLGCGIEGVSGVSGERGRREEKSGRIRCVVWRRKVGGGVRRTDVQA